MLSFSNSVSVYLTVALLALPLLAYQIKRNNENQQLLTSGNKMNQQTPKTVIIVGGSYAGIGVAQQLLKEKSLPNLKFILINPTDLFYFNVAGPRVIAKPGFFKDEEFILAIPELFAKFGRRFELVVGSASGISIGEGEEGGAKTVTVVEKGGDDGSLRQRQIVGDYLVLASGTTTPSSVGSAGLLVPFKPGDESLVSHIRDAQAALKNARDVVIGGGGPVGVEFAGELAEAFQADGKQEARITMVSASEHLLPGLIPAAQNSAEKILESKGVSVVPRTRIVQATQIQNDGKWTLTLSTGETITMDAYVSAAGAVPNNGFIPSSLLNEDGFVPVDDQFRVLNAFDKTPVRGVYALGDITQLPYRLVSRIAKQTRAVFINLEDDVLGGTGKRATGYDPEKELFALVAPIGKGQGTGQIGSIVAFSWLVAFLKGRDYFTSKVRSILQV